MSAYIKYELTTEERAVIYNHIFEIQKDFIGMGPLNVLVEKSSRSGNFQVAISTTDTLNLAATGRGCSLFEASTAAKSAFLKKLGLLSSANGSPERALRIFSILNGGSVLH